MTDKSSELAAPAAAAIPRYTDRKRALIVATNKGGVGKSTEALMLTAAIRRRIGVPIGTPRRSVSLWDLDRGNGSIATMYESEDPLVGAGTDDIEDDNATDFIDALYSAADDVILDIPGGRTPSLYRTFVGGPTALVDFLVHETKREVILISPIGSGSDTMATVLSAFEIFGRSVHHVIVKNGRFDAENAFYAFEGTIRDGQLYAAKPEHDPLKLKATNGVKYDGNLRKLADTYAATTVYLPQLTEDTVKILRASKIAPEHAIDAADRITRRHQYNTKSWLEWAARRLTGTAIDPAGFPSSLTERSNENDAAIASQPTGNTAHA